MNAMRLCGWRIDGYFLAQHAAVPRGCVIGSYGLPGGDGGGREGACELAGLPFGILVSDCHDKVQVGVEAGRETEVHQRRGKIPAVGNILRGCPQAPGVRPGTIRAEQFLHDCRAGA